MVLPFLALAVSLLTEAYLRSGEASIGQVAENVTAAQVGFWSRGYMLSPKEKAEPLCSVEPRFYSTRDLLPLFHLIATYTHSPTEPATAPTTRGHTQLSVKAAVMKPAINATTRKSTPDMSALPVPRLVMFPTPLSLLSKLA